ncbi:hypothetical protein [Phenylobacterium sp.]|uniref:hypothetical protein n=1 Tax=Phenylobacterium sp. TaxID=1871053 RepID=UPI0027263673|nr:hypothetical protein [Phenylobacterium sp.]MDO8800046.1 hypothetical protein [Phenylobacterium sp.]
MRIVLIGLGLTLMLVGLFYDIGAPGGEVVNLGRIAEKQIVFSLGAVFFLAGVVMLGAHRIVGAIGGKAPADTSESEAPVVLRPGYVVGGRKPKEPKV